MRSEYYCERRARYELEVSKYNYTLASALCEADGECGTNRSLNNCKGDGIFRMGPDVYRKRCEKRPGPFASVDLTLKSTAPAFADVDLGHLAVLRANRRRRRVGGTQGVGGTRCDCTPTQNSRTHEVPDLWYPMESRGRLTHASVLRRYLAGRGPAVLAP